MSTDSECKKKLLNPSMLIFGVHEGERVAVDVPLGATVGEVKKMIQVKLNIYFDDLVKQDKKVLVMSYAGSDLNDAWIFTDLGIVPGSTCKVCMKEEVKPVLFVKCSHSGEVIEIMDDYFVEKMEVADLRTMVTKKSGLPVSIFRLVSRNNLELFDGHTLFDYGIECGDTIFMECWDGWTELINFSILGLTPSVTPLIVQDEIQSRFQLKVVMYISAHYGRVDLARTCIKAGIKPDEPIGEHPTRQWCWEQSHIETKRSAVHEAAEFGQLGVLRLFVTTDITCSMAREGHSLTPLNLALRNKQRPCASFLLTKQWVRVPVTRSQSMTLQTFRRIKTWCERCKEKAFMKFGPNKSSLKRRSFNTGPLVSHGVIVDGFSQSPMNGKNKHDPAAKDRKHQLNESTTTDGDGKNEDPEAYFKHLTAVQTYGPKFRQNTRWGKMVGKSSVGALFGLGLKNAAKGDRPDGNEAPDSPDVPETPGPDGKETKLPPIMEKGRLNISLSQSQPHIAHGIPEEQEKAEGDKLNPFLEKGRKYIRTGPTGPPSKSKISASMPNMKMKGDTKEHEREKVTRDRIASISSSKSEKTTERANTSMSMVSKKKKVTSAMLVQQGNKANMDGTVPLPIISSENESRPFFYHNGVRENDIVIPMMNLVQQYQGMDSRDRAAKSLAIANTFKEKPWLMQVRMAMSLTSSTLKRDVKNLRHSFHEVKRHEQDRRVSRARSMIV
ncbi:ANKUB-like protein [Mya arenaria]|uniref:ANKUB-like protein n=1 Tax=Mya arenaria TaxID=6604 RepID=A0ABY7E8B1_MYAAR|nr:protein ANKUB1-like [Mya arenaria]XP_052797846.1 protein ANKUB1-like [Mya arenaria]WAR03386.1 ANKUB-like protein [Mya arenaria]